MLGKVAVFIALTYGNKKAYLLRVTVRYYIITYCVAMASFVGTVASPDESPNSDVQ